MTYKQILIVDDNPLSRKLLNEMLRAEGFSVLVAASGGEALETIAKQRPDIVLLDVMMPEMDGFEVVRRLKANEATRSTPIIMVTALDDDGARKRLANAGVDSMLTKPIDRWELHSLLTRVLSAQAENNHE
ncbi:MAG: response regulator [Candidatus Thiodiazotropha sp.]